MCDSSDWCWRARVRFHASRRGREQWAGVDRHLLPDCCSERVSSRGGEYGVNARTCTNTILVVVSYCTVCCSICSAAGGRPSEYESGVRAIVYSSCCIRSSMNKLALYTHTLDNFEYVSSRVSSTRSKRGPVCREYGCRVARVEGIAARSRGPRLI